jgi:predicted nucleic acid-binding protein
LRSYVDTSVLVSALTKETRTADVQAWMARQNPGDLAISPWVVTEFSAALSLKIRSGQLGLEHRAAALSAFSRITAESFHVLAVSDRHYRVAARFADQAPLGVRAGDALHLAIAFEAGLGIATLDRKLAEAGSALGVPMELL